MFRINSLSSVIRSLVLVAFSATMFSFSTNPGGDVFTISLNGKEMIKQFVHRDATVKTLSLNESNGDDMLRIQYDHCGKTGTARTIALAANQKVLKLWNFIDGDGTPMLLKVKDVIAAQKSNGNKSVQLVYTSKELPEGRTLVSVGTSNASASLQ
jgi:hypothetical protein